MEITQKNYFWLKMGALPGQINGEISGITLTNDNKLGVLTGGTLQFFTLEGQFINRVTLPSPDDNLFNYSAEVSKFLIKHISGLNHLSWLNWTRDGHIVGISGSKIELWKRAYRTKGLFYLGQGTPNVIPRPVVRSVAQRPGTNILDVDFEILDSDDATATAGLVASVNGNFDDLTQLIVPTAWTDGTESKIGAPIATNQVHRVSWYVKGDWNEPTGDLKVGVLARDARRTKPVDLHFLELPFDEGKLTISRSPLKDTDVSNFLLYELAKGSASVSLQYG